MATPPRKLGILMLSILFLGACTHPHTPRQTSALSQNKRMVKKYMEGFNEGNHAKILSCLTEDVVWELPGVYLHKGKAAFDKEIENEAFTGKPIIKVNRMTEQHHVVIAEGTVQATKKTGEKLNIVFADVFEMKSGLIKKLTSYLMVKPR